MMEGENVKALAHSFNLAQPKAGSSGRDGIKRGQEPRYCRPKSFDEFIRHQIQALIVCFFIIKDKEKALRWLTEASQSDGKKAIGIC